MPWISYTWRIRLWVHACCAINCSVMAFTWVSSSSLQTKLSRHRDNDAVCGFSAGLHTSCQLCHLGHAHLIQGSRGLAGSSPERHQSLRPTARRPVERRHQMSGLPFHGDVGDLIPAAAARAHGGQVFSVLAEKFVSALARTPWPALFGVLRAMSP